MDSTKYRFYHLRQSIQHTIRNELEHQKYRCTRCGTVVNALDVPRLLDPRTGQLVCDRQFGRNRTCSGEIREEDTVGELERTRGLQSRLESELRPLLQLLTECDEVHVPAHPLEGANETVWGKYVPETVDPSGQDLSQPMEEFAMYGGRAPNVEVEIMGEGDPGDALAAAKMKADEAAIPEKPSWFSPSAEKQQATDQSSQPTSPGSAQTKENNPGSAKAETDGYYEQYLKAQKANKNRIDPAVEVVGDEMEGDEGEEEFDADFQDEAFEDASATGLDAQKTADEASVDPGQVTVAVAGEQVKLSEVTEEHTEKMTADEYQEYYEKLRKAGFIQAEEEE
eukprot:CAMPEP_0182450142 /NCGR_PEP_ID=MMETSP1172-20130603/39181_1 /TAXON_ID=708627 /ORGANISM="Timspurckia oligopyrenoides, Strain CCMP3278" /LENGTH=338 /DNA_ID=CAMNT_0024647651 /DNA_START=1 /DNA_END=1017 /DNA_ORIENTATION=+